MSRKVPPSCCEVDSTAPPAPGRRRARATAFVSALLLATTFGVASAQDARGILAPGNAVVTGFSGTQAPPPAPNSNRYSPRTTPRKRASRSGPEMEASVIPLGT